MISDLTYCGEFEYFKRGDEAGLNEALNRLLPSMIDRVIERGKPDKVAIFIKHYDGVDPLWPGERDNEDKPLSTVGWRCGYLEWKE